MSLTPFKQLHLQLAGRIEVCDLIANLPTVGIVEGEARYVDEVKGVYLFDGTVWNPISSGGSAFFDTLTVNNLTVNTVTHLNSNVVDVGDNIVVLNSQVTGAPSLDAGLEINRGNQPPALLLWNEATQTWEAGVQGSLADFPGSSPGFTLARAGAVTSGAWLLANGIPSNLTGLHNIFSSSHLKFVSVDSSSVSTFDLTIYEHDHSVYTSLTTISVVGAYGGTFALNIPLTAGKNLAAQVTSGSGSDISAILILSQG